MPWGLFEKNRRALITDKLQRFCGVTTRSIVTGRVFIYCLTYICKKVNKNTFTCKRRQESPGDCKRQEQEHTVQQETTEIARDGERLGDNQLFPFVIFTKINLFLKEKNKLL